MEALADWTKPLENPVCNGTLLSKNNCRLVILKHQYYIKCCIKNFNNGFFNIEIVYKMVSQGLPIFHLKAQQAN